MKQFDELDKREKQSKSRVEIKSHLTRKNIVIVCICLVGALILALLWTNIYVYFQTRRLVEWQSENKPSANNLMFAWDIGNVSTTSETSPENNATSSYKDLVMEFVGAEKSSPSSDYLQLYLKINNPNTETVNIRTTGIYLNDVCVEDLRYLDSIVGNKETTIKVQVDHSSIIASQIGDEIKEVSIQYNYENESNYTRECKDDNFLYRIGDAVVQRGDLDANETIKNEEKKQEIYGILSNDKFEGLGIKYMGMENTSTYIALNFLVENRSSSDYDIAFWYESSINGYTLEMKSTSELSGDIVPAEGSVLLTIKYEPKDIQYCGITEINEICFLIGENDSTKEGAVEVAFEDLDIGIQTAENTINNSINGVLSEGEMSDGIKIDYVGYDSTSTYVGLNFIVENTSDDYYGFVYWYASQVNKCALNMKSTSEVSGALEGEDKILLTIKYAPEELTNAGIDTIDELSFYFGNASCSKEDASVAQFSGLNVPVN